MLKVTVVVVSSDLEHTFAIAYVDMQAICLGIEYKSKILDTSHVLRGTSSAFIDFVEVADDEFCIAVTNFVGSVAIFEEVACGCESRKTQVKDFKVGP